MTADFYSASEGTASSTAFLLRFMTRFPTGNMWLHPVIGASFTPYGTTGTGVRNTDAPTLFAGNVFLLIQAQRGSGWVSVELPVLVVHSPGAGSTGSMRDFGRDLILQPTAYVHLGSRLFRDFGARWSRLDLFGFLEQNLTPNRNSATGRRDRLNPVAAFGVSVNLGAPPAN